LTGAHRIQVVKGSVLVDVKVAALAALLTVTAYPAADPGLHPDARRPLAGNVRVEHVFDC
jgi:hypothetical protein